MLFTKLPGIVTMSLSHMRSMREVHFIPDLINILSESMRPTQFLTVLFLWGYAIQIIIIGLTGQSPAEMKYIFSLAPWWFWSTLLAALGSVRLSSMFYRPNNFLQYSFPVLGIWFWTMLFVSSIVDKFNDIDHFVIYVIMILIEIWIMARTVSCWAVVLERRRNIKERRG